MTPGDNFLSMQSMLKARIESALPELAGRVHLVQDDTTVLQKAHPVNVWIMPGQLLIEDASPARALNIAQHWIVMLSVHNVSQQPTGQGARDESGPILSRLLHALHGWLPDNNYGWLAAVTPSMEPAYDNGVFYYPLEFKTQFSYPAKSLEESL